MQFCFKMEIKRQRHHFRAVNGPEVEYYKRKIKGNDYAKTYKKII